jgi:hypothetical protein
MADDRALDLVAAAPVERDQVPRDVQDDAGEGRDGPVTRGVFKRLDDCPVANFVTAVAAA